MNAIEQSLKNAAALIGRAMDEQGDAIERAADMVYACVSGGGMVYAFGTGHAHMLAEELFYRAGGLAAVCPILDERLMLHISASASTEYERQAGYAGALLARYPVKPGDVMIVASNSGRNAAPVEMAAAGRARGMGVIAVTNVAHSASAAPRNGLGKRLYELADVVLDNLGEIGDAAIDVGLPGRVAPTSTVVGAAMLQAMVARVAQRSAEDGRPVDAYASSNIDGGDQINARILEAYRPRISFL
ncbi:MAG: SIS domain-containing protein [Clostridiales bacterium]|nr:SIS domain-containing protein [Clostridiales bacterium]